MPPGEGKVYRRRWGSYGQRPRTPATGPAAAPGATSAAASVWQPQPGGPAESPPRTEVWPSGCSTPPSMSGQGPLGKGAGSLVVAAEPGQGGHAGSLASPQAVSPECPSPNLPLIMTWGHGPFEFWHLPPLRLNPSSLKNSVLRVYHSLFPTGPYWSTSKFYCFHGDCVYHVLDQ